MPSLAERQTLISKEGLRKEHKLSAAHRHKGGGGEPGGAGRRPATVE